MLKQNNPFGHPKDGYDNDEYETDGIIVSVGRYGLCLVSDVICNSDNISLMRYSVGAIFGNANVPVILSSPIIN